MTFLHLENQNNHRRKYCDEAVQISLVDGLKISSLQDIMLFPPDIQPFYYFFF